MGRLVTAAILLCAALSACYAQIPTLSLATTTSVANSGLLDVLLVEYGRQDPVVVQTHFVGSGRALAMLGEHQVDIAITHAPDAEAAALGQHPSWAYAKLMFNDFVLVGPESDPAGARGSRTAAVAMGRIARSRSRFISRGDQSGTHEREQALWRAAGSRPRADRLVVAGSSMGVTLRIAAETASYTLTDRATYLQQKAPFPLAIVYEHDPVLLNTYAVAFDSASARAHEAKSLADWLTGASGRRTIENYTVGPGVRAFEPWPVGRPGRSPDSLPR